MRLHSVSTKIHYVLPLIVCGVLACGGDQGGSDTDTEATLEDVVDDATIDDVVDTPAPPGDLAPANQPPTITLLAPEDGTSFAWRAPVVLRAAINDDADAPDTLRVRWSSPIQGEVFRGSPRGDGLVELTTDTLVLGTHLLTLSAVDSDGAEASADIMIDVRAAEGAPRISIAPLDPVTADDLRAQVDDYVLDGTAGPLTVTWSWYRGAEAVPAIDGDTVLRAATTKGETWRVEAVVSDGVETTPPGVAQVTVINAQPACPGGATITRAAGAGGTLSCACARREDLDEADVIDDRCLWTIDGAAAGAAGECLLDAGEAAAGTVFGCTFVPFDGDEEGAPVVATPYVMPDASGNSAPLPPEVAIDPKFGAVGYRYTCSVVTPSVDAQGDAVSYRVAWSVAGHWGAAGDAWTVVPERDLQNAQGAAAADGDELRCQVVASDGLAESQPGVSEAVLMGTAGVSVGGQLGDVALDEPLGGGCWKDSDHVLPACVPDVVCAVDVVACFDADGTLREGPTLEAVVSLPGLGEVALSGTVADDGSWVMSGAAPDVGPPTLALPMSGLTLTVAVDADGASRTTLSGEIEIDGVRYPFEGAEVSTFLTGGGADLTSLRVAVPLPDLVIEGMPMAGTLTLNGAEPTVPFEGEVSIADVGELPVTGALELTGKKVTTANLSAGFDREIAGVAFAGETQLTLAGGVWQLALSEGVMTLPGGVELSLGGTLEVVRGRLEDAALQASVVDGAGVVFAGVAFEGGIEVRWSRDRYALSLTGGLLGPGGPTLSLSGAVDVEDGVVVGGELTAGTDLVIAGVQFSGEAAVTFDETSLTVALAAGVVDLPEGGAVSLAGAIVLEEGALASATFEGSGDVAIAGVRFGGDIAAEWSGGRSWSVELAGGEVALPGGSEVELAGALAVVDGRVVSGSFAAGSDLVFDGLRFAGQASASYRVERDGLDNVVGHTLSLNLSGAELAVAGAGELSLAGAVEIAQGAVESASFAAGSDVSIGGIRFAGEAAVSWSRGDGLALELSGGELSVAGARLTLGGALRIVDGALTCGELTTALSGGAGGAVTTTIGGVGFDLGIRYAAANTTCAWKDGTTTRTSESQFVASLANGRLTVGPFDVLLAGNATLEGGTLACAVLDAGGGAALPVGGVDFALGARYAAAGRTCPWTVGVAASSS